LNILTIPLRNLRRKALRTILLAVIFSIGILSVVALSFVSRAVGENLEEKMNTYGGNILVTPRAETLAVGYGGMPLGDVSVDLKYLQRVETVQAIRSIPRKDRISAAAPKFAVLTTVAGKPLGVIGVDWVEEMNIKSYWAVAAGARPDEPHQLLAGNTAARIYGMEPGSELLIEGQPFTVSGVLASTGGEDDNVIFGDIGALQRVTGRGDVAHFVEVSALCAGCPVEEIVAEIEHVLPGVEVKALQQVVKQRMMTVQFVNSLALSVSMVILLTACVMIGLSVFSAVNERKHEIGVMRSLGFSRVHVFAVFSLEALLTGVLAGAIGYAGGFGVSAKVLTMLEMTRTATLTFDPAHFVLTMAGVALLSVAAAAYPAFKAARMEPSRALVVL
jgi:putative ABC transport system permease protein